MAAIAEETRLMPHLHLSLQHGHDLILKRMKRRHSRAAAVRFAREVRQLRPDVVFGADLIAGFPTEGEEHARASESLIDECGLTYLHVFPFSPRKGTPAARMPELDRRLVKERAARLRAKGEAALATHLAAETGAVRSVLVEQAGLGRTEHFMPAAIDRGLPGEIVAARVTGATARALVASALPLAA
jgi:threonylcarbamoyladenosine tRNA methylthiotransferase MtaB